MQDEVVRAKNREYYRRRIENDPEYRIKERERRKRYREKRLEAERERSRRYRKEHPEEYRKKCREYYRRRVEKNPEEYRAKERERVKRYVEKYPEVGRERIKRYREKHPEYIRKYDRVEAMKKISNNLMCNKCGCSDLRILEINHINGGGNKELREVGGGFTFYSSIISGKRPIDDLELLCKICNVHHYVEDILGITGFKITYSA